MPRDLHLYIFVFHALGFLPSNPSSRFQAQSYVDTVFGGTPPSTITNAAGLPGGFGKPNGGGALDGSGNLWSGEKPILPDEVTQKSPKTTCVVVFL